MDHTTLPATQTATASQHSEERFAVLEEVFLEHQAEIFRSLYFLLGHTEDATDALQEAFLRCWKHRAEVPEIKNLKAWIFRISLNIGRDILKSAWNRRKKNLPEDDCFPEQRELSPQGKLSEKELLAHLRLAVEELSEEEREVYLLRESGDFTYEQIAEILQLPAGTVKTRMKRTVDKLRQKLQKFQPE